MANTQYLALLRGINVGGGNIIKMTDWKACLEASKLENVATYSQCGNVLFETAEKASRAEAVRYLIVIEKSKTGYSAYYPICLAASPLTALVQLSRRPCVRP